MIDGIPDGWELVRIGQAMPGNHWLRGDGGIEKWGFSHTSALKNYVIIRKIEKPKRYRPFANAAEFEPHRDRWVYSSKQRSDNAEGAESPEDEHSKVLAYGDHGVTIQDYSFCFDTAFRYFVFSDDGTPFGIEVTE